jgi:hypothetical protein
VGDGGDSGNSECSGYSSISNITELRAFMLDLEGFKYYKDGAYFKTLTIDAWLRWGWTDSTDPRSSLKVISMQTGTTFFMKDNQQYITFTAETDGSRVT